MRFVQKAVAATALVALAASAAGQERGDNLTPAPNRRSDEGKGPFKTLVIRGAMLIDGTGGPPRGPVDIVVEQNRIKEVRGAGTPGLPLRANRQPDKPDFEIDATGKYVMPGFVDLHVHGGGGHTFTSGEPHDALAAAAFHRRHGTTTLQASLVTADHMEKKLVNTNPLHVIGDSMSAIQRGSQIVEAFHDFPCADARKPRARGCRQSPV